MTPPGSVWTPQEHHKRTFMEVSIPTAPKHPPHLPTQVLTRHLGVGGGDTRCWHCLLWTLAESLSSWVQAVPGEPHAQGVQAEAPKPLGGGNPKSLLPSEGLLAQTRQGPRARGPSWEGSELRGVAFSGRKETRRLSVQPLPSAAEVGGRWLLQQVQEPGSFKASPSHTRPTIQKGLTLRDGPQARGQCDSRLHLSVLVQVPGRDAMGSAPGLLSRCLFTSPRSPTEGNTLQGDMSLSACDSA